MKYRRSAEYKQRKDSIVTRIESINRSINSDTLICNNLKWRISRHFACFASYHFTGYSPETFKLNN
jgi:hypothetical protein